MHSAIIAPQKEGGDGEVRRLKAIIDAVNRIDSSLQTIAQAYKPVETGFMSITLQTICPTGRTIGTFEVGDLGWKKLKKSKEIRAFLTKLEECQTLDSQIRQQDRQD